MHSISKAAQQRYARSPFGVDALIFRLPYFRHTSSSEWPHAVVDALMLIVDVAMVDALSHVIGHYNGCNLAAELLVEIISLCFWFMRPTARQAEGPHCDTGTLALLRSSPDFACIPTAGGLTVCRRCMRRLWSSRCNASGRS